MMEPADGKLTEEQASKQDQGVVLSDIIALRQSGKPWPAYGSMLYSKLSFVL